MISCVIMLLPVDKPPVMVPYATHSAKKIADYTVDRNFLINRDYVSLNACTKYPKIDLVIKFGSEKKFSGNYKINKDDKNHKIRIHISVCKQELHVVRKG